MPLLDYYCRECGAELIDEFVKTTDELRECPMCKTIMDKRPPETNFVIK